MDAQSVVARLKALSSSSLPHIPFDQCRTASSLKRLVHLPAIKALSALWKSALLDARVGFNAGSRSCSFTFELEAPRSVLLDASSVPDACIIIRTMLALWPFQAEVEESWREGGAACAAAEYPNSAANEALRLFSSCGVVISDYTRDCARGTGRVSFCSIAERNDCTSGFDAFWYRPHYHTVIHANGAQHELAHTMMEEIWQCMEQVNYVAPAALKESVEVAVRAYVGRGVDGLRNRFAPSKGSPVALYLHGLAGIGKSSFVRAFSVALERTLRKYAVHDMRVRVVKVPLNAATPASLQSVLMVRGISDMSIERVVEQTLTKGHVVIVHQEENPEDHDLQDQLNQLTKKMLGTLAQRYGEYRSNLIVITTSNYEPSPVCRSIFGDTVLARLDVPRWEEQRKWCISSLSSAVSAHVRAASATVVLEDGVPATKNDMREVEQWWRTAGYHISKEVRSGGRDLSACHLEIVLCRSEASAAPVGPCGGVVIRAEVREVQEGSDRKHLMDIDMHACNGVFFHSAQRVQPGNEAAAPWPCSAQAAQCAGHCARAMVEMVLDEYIQPGVIVLVGSEQGRSRQQEWICRYVRERVSDGCVFEDDVVVRDPEHCARVFGTSRQVQGGLFKFIADVHHATARENRTCVGVVTVRANEVGQFLVRELLEAGSSSTHRQFVSKEHILFLVSVDTEAAVTPQLTSRAHHVIDCDQ